MIILIVRLPSRIVSFACEHFEWLLLVAAMLVVAGVLATLPKMPR